MRDMERILVVDDDPAIRRLLEMFLASRGYRVSTASNGLEAVAAVEADQPHLILLDIMMPGMNGLETLRRIRQMDSTVAIIIITGFSGEEIAKDAMRQAAAECITKPIDLGYLELSILAGLAQKNPSPHSEAAVRSR